ncbi:MAG: RES family NAD+ phosphorylase [Acidimicrobiia bacterium]|nr:RES family NAD+ phosphorylase [Acidimicrobiia bacterium]
MASIDPKAVARASERSLSAMGFRNQARGFNNPLSGEGARRFGGRYNPPQSFPVIYLCTTPECAVAELIRQARAESLAVEDLCPREFWRIEGELHRVLDLLDDSTLSKIGVDRDDLIRDDLTLTRQIGEAAHEHQFQAILAPSATGVDQVLAIFTENLAGAVLDPTLIGEWKEPCQLPI